MSTVHDVRALPTPTVGTPAKFPTAHEYPSAAQQTARAARSIEPAALDRAAATLLQAYTHGVGVFVCGNGGSAAIANHLQCDHVKGVRTTTDLAPRVVSLSASIEFLTAIANDIAYEDVFAYQLQSQSGPGDVLIAISSSGRSPNVVRALTWARDTVCALPCRWTRPGVAHARGDQPLDAMKGRASRFRRRSRGFIFGVSYAISDDGRPLWKGMTARRSWAGA